MSDDGATELAQVVELAKRRGFFFAANEPYGGTAGFWTYGPAGAALKRNVEQRWRERFAHAEGHMEIQSPTIIPEPVFDASGHLEDFTDWVIECPACGTSYRADHLVEATGEVDDAEGLPASAIEALIEDLDITCRSCGETLADIPVGEFNLMFETTIGPGSGEPGYLRPETAQGTFVDFPRLAEYARGQLPFGAVQIGSAYRNEISPRRAIIRVREMTQAELELFYDPDGEGPPIDSVADVELPLYPIEAQESGGSTEPMSVEEAVDAGVIANPWIGYYLGVAATWYIELGVDEERLRFRQHLPGERAHYAVDCWDAEAYLGDDWIELAGFADRTDYDLSKHHEYGDASYTVFKPYDEPQTVERATVDPDMATLGPEFGSAAADIADALEALVDRSPDAFDSGDTVKVDAAGETYEIPIESTGYTVETVTESGEHIMPHVAEPAFGIDRLVYTLIEHNYREDVIDGEERAYLALSPRVAPTLAGVFPLVDADGLPDRAEELATRLAEAGLAVTYDASGAIGRRYRRQDEIGTPYCLTVDHQTLDDGTVTLRDRDTTDQVRIDADETISVLRALRAGDTGFEQLTAGDGAEPTAPDG